MLKIISIVTIVLFSMSNLSAFVNGTYTFKDDNYDCKISLTQEKASLIFNSFICANNLTKLTVDLPANYKFDKGIYNFESPTEDGSVNYVTIKLEENIFYLKVSMTASGNNKYYEMLLSQLNSNELNYKFHYLYDDVNEMPFDLVLKK